LESPISVHTGGIYRGSEGKGGGSRARISGSVGGEVEGVVGGGSHRRAFWMSQDKDDVTWFQWSQRRSMSDTMTRARNPVVFLEMKMCMALIDLVHYYQFHNIKLQARTLVEAAELVGTGKR